MTAVWTVLFGLQFSVIIGYIDIEKINIKRHLYIKPIERHTIHSLQGCNLSLCLSEFCFTTSFSVKSQIPFY